MASALRSKVDMSAEANEERVLGLTATGDIDNAPDHLANVERGLKAALSNPNTSTKAKKQAEAKLEALNQPPA